MNWAQRRKLLYMMSILLVLAIALSLVVRQATKVAPTCYDGKQNQSEVGVDCGGPCTFYCVNELGEPKVRWVRTFEIRPGIVHAVAYIEHTYPTAAARKIHYSFRLYDEKNTLITEREGDTYLGTMGRTAIVETLIKTGNVKPSIVRFAIAPPIPWEKIPAEYSQVVIKTDRTFLEPLVDSTRLTATIENTSRISFRDTDVVALLYDKDDNVVTSSQALVQTLPGMSSQTLSFTWPFAMPVPITRIEIIPRLNPFTSTSL
jgi:hypothetical protein